MFLFTQYKCILKWKLHFEIIRKVLEFHTFDIKLKEELKVWDKLLLQWQYHPLQHPPE